MRVGVCMREMVIVGFGDIHRKAFLSHRVHECLHGAIAACILRGELPKSLSQNLGAGKSGLFGHLVQQSALVARQVNLDRLADNARSGALAH